MPRTAERHRLTLAAACLIATAACGSSSTPTTPGNTTPTVSSIAVIGTTPIIPTASQFTATVTMTDGTTQNATTTASWTSSNPAIATVAAGLVTPLTPGDVTITATFLGVPGRTSMTIAKP